jgi:hypothetical protein
MSDKARPQISLHITEAITNFGYRVLPNPPYSPDLALTDYHVSGTLKKREKTPFRTQLRQRRGNAERRAPVAAEEGQKCLHPLLKRWKTVDKVGEYIEKQLSSAMS